MPKFNDLDLKNWKEIDLNMDSLWIIPERKKWWKHSNFYHWNFIPQIPEHFIHRYTKKWWWVLDLFLWSGTTAVECENLERNIVGIDLQEELVNRAKELIDSEKMFSHFWVWDSWSEEIKEKIQKILHFREIEGFDLVFLHPPYDDIVKFSDNKNCLSNCKNIENFYEKFSKVAKNAFDLLKKWWYCVLVVGDKYQNSEWIPLWFNCMNECLKVGFKLKSTIVKNMEWNRGKLWNGGIWKYRALNSDYYLFKHEYIFVFKK